VTERERRSLAAWQLQFDTCDPQDERRREALLAQGNGVLLVRAAAPWVSASEQHYPGTYHAGIYNALQSEIAGEAVWDTSLVNLPNWLPLDIRGRGGAWLADGAYEVLDYQHVLDIRHGLMHRRLKFRDGLGRETQVEEERLVSMAQPQLAGLQLIVTPLNWSGVLEMESGIDGSVINDNVERFRDYAKRHLRDVRTGHRHDGVLTVEAGLAEASDRVAVAVHTDFGDAAAPGELQHGEGVVSLRSSVALTAGTATVIQKCAAIIAGPDVNAASATAALSDHPCYRAIRQAHCAAWEQLWLRGSVVAASSRFNLPLNLHLFHVLQNYAPNTVERDVGFPARSWQEAYRGHVFWDELFVSPVFVVRYPELVRSMLLYRYRRLDAARANAHRFKLDGALFPWRSARSGAEETPRFQKNPRNGRWHRDLTDFQVHINAAIAWVIVSYAETTGDTDFMATAGLEMLVEIARCWASIAHHDQASDRFDIRGVVGPDEYHTRYPGSDARGIDNNAYTNVMASWTLRTVASLIESAPQTSRFGVTDEEIARWHHVSERLRLPMNQEGILIQFEGYDRLEPLDMDALGSGSVDWKLDEMGRDVNDFRVSKQADFAMLLYLFTPEQLIELVERLGYTANRSTLRRALHYAAEHTSHGSSLSQTAYAGAFGHFDAAQSRHYYEKTLQLELNPAYGESSREGVHLGAMAGSLDVLQRIYLGLRVRESGIVVTPVPNHWLEPVKFDFTCRFGAFTLSWDGRDIVLAADGGNSGHVRVHTLDGDRHITPGSKLIIPCDRQQSDATAEPAGQAAAT
jgi:trehalose/maltose hydrolase-like predicted phosphorylase